MTESMFLKSKGYGEETPDAIYRADGVTYWYRKAPGTDRQQFIVRKWPAIKTPVHIQSMPIYEVEMTYETRNGIWATTKFYGLSYTQLCANLDRLESSLREAIGSMGGNPQHYQFDGEG